MAATPWRDWDRRLIGWFLVGLLVLVVLVGDPRGGSSDDSGTGAGAPVTASPRRLCGALDQMAAMRDDLVDGSSATTVADLREAAIRTREVGRRTRGLDAQAAAGLDYFTGFFVDLPEQPSTEQLMSSGAPASITDQAHADAFVSWLEGNCPQPDGPAR